MNFSAGTRRMAARGIFWVGLALGMSVSWAQTTAPVRKPATAVAPRAAKPATAPVQAAAKPVPRSGKGWQVGPVPAWVAEPPAPDTRVPPAPNAGSRRAQLVDIQVNHALPKPQTFVRVRSVALDAGALGSVSQWPIGFNPAFQTVVIHHTSVLRDGQRSERLADARIEPMRREARLEQQVLDGAETLLLVLSDVRVGDAVELAYSIEGENPIFEGRMSGGIRLAYDTPVELLHHRWVAPANRPLFTRSLAGREEVERSTEGPLQVLRAVRHQVAAIALEPGTPPWFKLYPVIDISEYRNWAEVDAWAQKLFALPTPADATVLAKAAALRATGLQGEALVSEALRFVQDEVRYLSVSLGESSHRPKPPQQTLAELLGDCKDKVVLLNTLLRELGFDARPALVSMQRNRGVLDYLPSPDLFDHVITRLDLGGRVWYLDATINGQGLALDSRGQIPYGAALVVGAGDALQAVPEGPPGHYRLQFEHLWDLSRPGQPVTLEFVMRAHGFAAERWRAQLSAVGLETLSQGLSGGFSRVLPGLKTSGTSRVNDDRQANRFEFRQAFEVTELGKYNRGFIEADFVALEMLDLLTGPAETQRRAPFLVDHPRLVDSRIEIRLPVSLPPGTPAPLELVERQFRYSARLEMQGTTASFVRRYERREDQVNPADLQAWREKILQARQAAFGRLRLPLLDTAAVVPELEKIERRLRAARGWRNDTLHGILSRNELGRHIDTQALARVAPDTPLAARVLVSRAVSNNLLGDFAAGRADADKALALRPDDTDALDARAVALLGEGQAEEALATFARITPAARPAPVSAWMGSVSLFLGRAAEAEVLLRDAVANGQGDGRDFAAAWLYLAAERQGGRGTAAIADHVEGSDPKKFVGALLRFLVGQLDRDALLKQAADKPEMERLNLAEAHFYIGQQLLARGQADEAQRWFQRCVDTQATPYREVSFAKLELKRAGR